jgi:hypothetical protein
MKMSFVVAVYQNEGAISKTHFAPLVKQSDIA